MNASHEMETDINATLIEVDKLVRTLPSQDGIIHVSIVIVQVCFAMLLGYVFLKHFFDGGGTVSLV